jgi:hypothetical protein
VYDFIYIAVRDRREKSLGAAENKGKSVLCLTGEGCKFVKTVKICLQRDFASCV